MLYIILCYILFYCQSTCFSPRRNHVYKSPPLNHSFADRHGGIVLKMLKQPESQHRARYMTEGSRGAVKDTEQQGHPVVQVSHHNIDYYTDYVTEG